MGPDGGSELPWDGQARGELQVTGPWIAREYYRDPRASESFTADGWLRTGDVATISADGYIRLVDRTKDVIKSGGEWISSVELENEIMAHPAVAEAAVIAIADDKWSERPLACVVVKPGQAAHRGRGDRLAAASGGQVVAARTRSCSSTRCRRPRSASSPRSPPRPFLVEPGRTGGRLGARRRVSEARSHRARVLGAIAVGVAVAVGWWLSSPSARRRPTGPHRAEPAAPPGSGPP